MPPQQAPSQLQGDTARARTQATPGEARDRSVSSRTRAMPPLPLQTLNADVAAANADLGRAAESGRKKAAAAAFKQLVELLATSDAARVHAAMLRDNRLRDGESDDPTWDGVLSRVLFLLSLANKLSKSDVEKLRLLVGVAIGAGHGALTARAELKVFCFVCSQLSKHEKMPIRADKLSAHPESIGVLLQLTNGRPHLLELLWQWLGPL